MKTVEIIETNGQRVPYGVEAVDECPFCHMGVTSMSLSFQVFWHGEDKKLAGLYRCNRCGRAFMTCSTATSNLISVEGFNVLDARLEYYGPKAFQGKQFDEKITSLSPRFVKIYNQAAEAETYDMDEIAGIGFRKSLEFLVKDFCIHKHPDDADQIKTRPLSQCINDYIDNDRIKALSTRAAWIGNDETHYVRKLEDRTISDMKDFIQAMVYYIGVELISEDALSISPS